MARRLWIAVESRLRSRDITYQLATICDVTRNEAVGLLCNLWGAIAEDAKRGVIVDKADVQLEEWACWAGEAGRFARFIRAECLLSNGKLKGWDEMQGPLEEARDKASKRQAKRRALLKEEAESREPTPIRHGDVTEQSRGTVQDRTVQVTTTTSSAPKRAVKKAAIQVVPVLSPDGEPWQDWLGVLASAWDEVNGAGSFPFGQAVRAFKPLHAKQGGKDLASRLRAYLTQNPAKFHNIQKFATTFQNYRDWSKERPIGDDGQPTAAYHDWMAAGCP